jgi:uncharacterized ion transporter superfamily protein YfcC
MFEKKVIIKDDFLIVGKKKLLWNQIIGIREQNSSLLKKISYRFPRAEIFLTGGRVVTISHFYKFQNHSTSTINTDKIGLESVLELIREKASNLKPDFNTHVEWRLVIPIIIFELVILTITMIKGYSFEEIALAIIFAGILGAVIGWVWEKKSRKKYYS